MKKLLACFLLAAMCLTLAACDKASEKNDDAGSVPTSSAVVSSKNDESTPPREDAGIQIDAKISLGVDEVRPLGATFIPAREGDDTVLVFESSDKKVLECDTKAGTITGKSAGTATVTIKNKTGEYTAETTVEVTDVLKDKTALFLGDSICAASVHDKDHVRWGWAGRVASYFGLKSYDNLGRDGASMSTCRGNNRVINHMNNARYNKYDFVLLHGGVNDAWDVIEPGTVSKSFNVADFDTSTYAGGLEEAIYYAKQYYKDAYIGYIFNFRMLSSTGRLSDMDDYYEVGKKICEKWEIPYLDLYSDETVFSELQKGGLADGIHPNSKGYDFLYPYVATFMRKMTFEK